VKVGLFLHAAGIGENERGVAFEVDHVEGTLRGYDADVLCQIPEAELLEHFFCAGMERQKRFSWSR